MSFKDLGVNAALIKALVATGIEKPFPIQKATLPDAIAGKDILGRGQTGSGKTLAFGLALMTRLAGKTAKPMQPLALILSPTRELAMQISDVIAPLSRTVNLNSQVVAGGLSYSKQIQALKRGVPIVVATPGRLIDLIQILLSLFDLVGVALIGVVGVLAISGVQAKPSTTAVYSILEILNLESRPFELQVAYIGFFAVTAFIIKTFASAILTRRTIIYISRKGSSLATNLLSAILSKPALPPSRSISPVMSCPRWVMLMTSK